MPKIAFVTDTDCSLPEDIAARYHIQQVPITVQFGEESFLTGVNIDDTALFERVDRENKLPSTAAPSPGQFLEAYDKALAAGADSILCFTVSSAVSATYNNAVNARQMLPERDITRCRYAKPLAGTRLHGHGRRRSGATRRIERRMPRASARRRRSAVISLRRWRR